MCDEKWICYNSQQQPAQWLDWEEAPKHFPKPNLHQTNQKKKKKRSWSLFGGLLPVQSTPAFWILVKPSDLRSMFSKLMRCVENCKACTWQCSTERAQFSSMTMPNHMLRNQCFKSWTNWPTRFCLICYIHLTFLQWLLFLKHFGNFLQQKCFSSVCWILNHVFLCYRNKFISQSMLIVIVPILINKDVFKPSYDLKFMVQTHNYVCTNLIWSNPYIAIQLWIWSSFHYPHKAPCIWGEHRYCLYWWM